MKLFAILSVIFVAVICEAKSGLQFDNARIFAPLKGSNATAGYVEIKNSSHKEVEISLKFVEKFKAYETHETAEEGGKMAMRKVDSFKIPASGNLELKPGGRHLMLFEPSQEIKEGSTIKVIFLVNGKDESVPFKVIQRQKAAEGNSRH